MQKLGQGKCKSQDKESVKKIVRKSGQGKCKKDSVKVRTRKV